MEGTWAPWTYHDEADNLVGYDVEVAQQIADRLGVKATFVEGKWDGLLAGLDAGRYDMMVNGVEMTEEREAKYDFTDPYGYIRTAIIVNGDNEEITAYEDLEGKSTANTISSTYAELAESYGAEVTGVDDLNQTFELLLSGRIDATLNAEVTYYDYMKAHPEANIKIAALTEEASHVAIPLRKGAETESLRAAINEALAELDEEGILSELSEKYFGSDISKAPNQ
ncbi:MAG: transporter substrate-binding domain-containing protein [Clostridiaceae bacterium]|nr:transporter substrate-binding domain-containing protein [Clostridiaceae bacterium]